jgi:hypothetical protein
LAYLGGLFLRDGAGNGALFDSDEAECGSLSDEALEELCMAALGEDAFDTG